jgi:hypothetical protein
LFASIIDYEWKLNLLLFVALFMNDVFFVFSSGLSQKLFPFSFCHFTSHLNSKHFDDNILKTHEKTTFFFFVSFRFGEDEI